ncbi:MAG TPA: hypothetical protein VGK84_08620 [Candidatus Tumulicola sp.]|jgi:DNA-binding beta-propeller fold protein YncE
MNDARPGTVTARVTFGLLAAMLGACSRSPGLLPGATTPVQVTGAATSAQHNLFVEEDDKIAEYDWTGNLVREIKHGIPKEGFNGGGIAFDSKGTMYVISGSFTISMYAPVTRKFIGVITDGLQTPLAIAVDHHDNLYAGNSIYQDVVVYVHGRKQPGRAISDGIAVPTAMAFDSRDNLYVANIQGNSVTVYSPDGKLLRTVREDVEGPEGLALDSKDDLFVANSNYGSGTTVTIYTPHSNKIVASLQTGRDPLALGTDAADNLYVANAESGTATVYGSPDWKLRYTISGLKNSRNLLVDAAGNLYLAGYVRHDARIKIYPPGSEEPSHTIRGIEIVTAMAFGPP